MPIPFHLSLHWTARKSIGVFWVDWGFLNTEAHHCTLALDAVHDSRYRRRLKELTLPLAALEQQTAKRRDVVGASATAEGNTALQNHGLKGPLKGPSPAQSRSNLGQAAQGWSN